MNVSSINSAAEARRLFATELNSTATDATASDATKQTQQVKKQASVAARQFEAIILRQLLSPAIEPLMSGGLTGGQAAAGGGGGVYGYLVTDVLANSLSQGGGLGLSKMLEKQLTPKGAVTAEQVSTAYNAGGVNNHE
jgi:peptidoglycan hydrolase FlgJ